MSPSWSLVSSASFAAAQPCWYFFVEATCFAYFDVLQQNRSRFTVVGLFALTAGSALSFQLLAAIGVAVTVIMVGTLSSKTVRRLRRYGDPSYGTYIYAFVIQQLLVQSGWARTPLVLLLLSAPLSLLAGYMSWHCVEHPVMRWVKGCRGRRLGQAATQNI